MTGIQTAVAAQKFDSRGWEVHDEVRYCRRDRHPGRFGSLCAGFAPGGALCRHGGEFPVFGSGEDGVGGLVNEGPTVFAEGTHKLGHLLRS